MLSSTEAWDKYNQALSQHLCDIQYGDPRSDKDDKAVPALWAQKAAFMFTWDLSQRELNMQLNSAITILSELKDEMLVLNNALHMLDELNGSVGEPDGTS